MRQSCTLLLTIFALVCSLSDAWIASSPGPRRSRIIALGADATSSSVDTAEDSTVPEDAVVFGADATVSAVDAAEADFTVPEDAVVVIKPAAMKRLRELRKTELKNPETDNLILRMGVRSGGCSGMSYIMDIVPEDKNEIAEDDAVDEYEEDKIQCVVDAKSMLYLYGLELDYSTELIGGGFKFYNPNAEESCGCGSSFGV